MRTLRTRTLFWMLALSLVARVGVVSPAAAQTDAGTWEIEFHGGGMLPTNPAAGTVSVPGPGQGFTTSAIFPNTPLVVLSSRRESSWYFGDGAILFNQVASAPRAVPFPGRMTTLDPVLGRRLASGGAGGASARASAAC